MIRRRQGEHLLLITQDDHAALSGRLAKHIGNKQFSMPSPFHLVVEAVSLHDCGWPLHDDRPTLNADGFPRDVFEMPPLMAVDVWAESSRRSAEVHPYVGLLVSLHGLQLSLFAQKPDGQGNPRHSPKEIFGINQFQHGQIELQEKLRRQLDMPIDRQLKFGLAELGRSPTEDLLLSNYSLLRGTDALSLNLCFNEPIFETITLCPHPGLAEISVRVSRDGADAMVLDPWPFNEPEMEDFIPARRLATVKFAEKAEFLAAFNSAPSEVVTLRFHKP